MNPLSKEEFLEKLKIDREFNSKYGRKHITEGKQVLPPCHYGFQVYTRELSNEERCKLAVNEGWMDKSVLDDIDGVNHIQTTWTLNANNIPTRAISLMWNQRSCDTFLGLPFNIASYGLLLEIIAKAVNMVPDELIGNLGDTHLYANHVEQAREQIGRAMTTEERMNWWFENRKPNRDVCDYIDSADVWEKHQYFDAANVPRNNREPYILPKLFINDEFWNHDYQTIDGWINSMEIGDFQLEGYQSHPSIKAPLSN